MDHGASNFNEYLGVLLRRKGLVLTAVTIVLVASVLLAFGLPAVYRSTATIMVEQPDIPQELVRSTVSSYSDHRINTVSQRVMTAENLAALIRKHDLYPEENANQPIGAILSQMRLDITMKTVSAEVVDASLRRQITATVAFTVSYDNASPQTAMLVANDLASLYLDENVKSRAQTVTKTADFLSSEADRSRSRLLEMEADLAEFKEHNADTLPVLSQLNVQLMDRAEKEMSEVEQGIRSVRERSIFLKADLAQASPTVNVTRTVGGQNLTPDAELQMLQTEYLSLAAIYAPDHPDVVNLGKRVSAVRAKVVALDELGGRQAELVELSGQLAAARTKYSENHPDVKRLKRAVGNLENTLARYQGSAGASGQADMTVDTAVSKADNPAYIRLRAQVNAAELELRTLQVRKNDLKAKLTLLEDRLLRAPQVERKYLALSRDYEHAGRKYNDIVEKQMSAQMAQELESEQKGERFTVIEPAPLPIRPIKPNRMGILSLGFVFSLVVGLAIALLAELLDGSVRGAKDVTALWKEEPLAIIPYIDNRGDVWRRATMRALVVVFVVGGVVGVALFVNEKVMPLDELMLVVMSRFGN